MPATTPAYRVEEVRSWSAFLDRTDQLEHWMFRGQGDASWQLWSKLSRQLRDYGVEEDIWPTREYRVLRTFKRKAHLFINQVPDHRDEVRWLAFMQHHGAPTRLLDLTYSPYVAAFFALESAAPGTRAAVWCFDAIALKWKAEAKLVRPGNQRASRVPLQDVSPKGTPDASRSMGEAQDNFFRYFLDGDVPFVFFGRPHVMNERLVAQNALFAIPSVINRPIDEILAGDPAWADGLLKIELSVDEVRPEAMREMFDMNLSHATLFPGLDGLARSMAYELEFEVTSERSAR